MIRRPRLVLWSLMIAMPHVAHAVDLEVVAVLNNDPTLQLVIAPGGELPDASMVSVEIEDSYAEVSGVIHLVDSGIPIATAIAVDTSRSMAPSFANVQDALRGFVDGMDGGDVVLITNFDEHVVGLGAAWETTEGKDRLKQRVNEMVAEGRSTHLYEGVNGVIDRLVQDSDEFQLRTALVLSDGADAGSPEGQTLDRARTNALQNDIRIYSVGYVPGRTDSTRLLQDLSNDTHGTYQLADGADAIERLFSETQTAIHEWLVVTIDAEAIPAGDHELRVKIGPRDQPVVVTYSLDLKRSFNGKDLKGNDPPDRTLLYAVSGTGTGIAVVGLTALAIRSRRRRERAIAADVARQIDEAKDASRRAAEQATAIRPTRLRLMTEDGFLDLFGLDAFGTRTAGSDSEGADLVIHQEGVSRCHATIERRRDDPNAMYVTDLGSSNGTYHQGLDLRGRGTIRVANRERLQFGLFATLVDISEV